MKPELWPFGEARRAGAPHLTSSAAVLVRANEDHLVRANDDHLVRANDDHLVRANDDLIVRANIVRANDGVVHQAFISRLCTEEELQT